MDEDTTARNQVSPAVLAFRDALAYETKEAPTMKLTRKLTLALVLRTCKTIQSGKATRWFSSRKTIPSFGR
jgi:hypothetical protein